MEAKEKTGTKEWAGDNVNIQIGCENGCRYCYARYGAVVWHKYCEPNEWNQPRINHDKVDKNYGFFKDGVMIPSTHDITEANVNEVIIVINKLLDAGNQVLIVSKPRWQCIPLVCESIKANHPDKFETKAMFRFTMGSTNDEVLKFWEPNATSFKERYSCLQYVFNAGFRTSVSCEPFLDGHPDYIYVACEDLVTDKIWIGLLRDFDKRCQLDDITEEQYKKYVRPLKEMQSPTIVKAIYKSMKDLPKIAWKDSIRKIIRGK